jgi:hypothetical protein
MIAKPADEPRRSGPIEDQFGGREPAESAASSR